MALRASFVRVVGRQVQTRVQLAIEKIFLALERFSRAIGGYATEKGERRIGDGNLSPYRGMKDQTAGQGKTRDLVAPAYMRAGLLNMGTCLPWVVFAVLHYVCSSGNQRPNVWALCCQTFDHFGQKLRGIVEALLNLCSPVAKIACPEMFLFDERKLPASGRT